MTARSKPRVACALCVGSAPEPYLSAALAAIAPVVDTLVVNDNSGLERSESVATIEAGPFATDRLRIVRRQFVDFATMRNDAFAALLELEPAPDWVLFLDADEVHGEQLAYLAEYVLPRLRPEVGELDAYTFHFWGTFDWITDVARRLVFYRFSPQLRWTNAIHEKLTGLRGGAVVVPYVYHHYGNVLAPRALAEKHQRYFALGNDVPRPVEPERAGLELYLERAHEVRPFRDRHPAAARATLALLCDDERDAFERLNDGFRARRTPLDRVRSAGLAFNETLRVRLRALEHPNLYRAPTIAR